MVNSRAKTITLYAVAAMCAVAIVAVALHTNASAISNDQRLIFNKSIRYYNICTTDVSGGNISSAIAAANDNAEAIFNALTTTNFKYNDNKPLNAVQVAAVLGNIQSESGFDPENSSGDFYGIAQWGGQRRAAIPEPQNSLESQIQHLINELNGEANDGFNVSAMTEFWESETEADLAKATFAWTRHYEIAIEIGSDYAHHTKWSDHATARTILQSWDATDNTQNPRWENAQAQYNLYKDKVPTVSSSSTEISDRIIWVGDSRTAGMEEAVTSGDNAWVAKIGASYSWFDSEGVPSVTKQLEDGDTIVFNMGVNGLSEAPKYISRLNDLADGDWADANIIVMSVNPVIDGKNNASNAQIEEFNKQMKEGLSDKIEYKDTYSELKNTLKDSDYDSEGLHYTNEVYLKLYDMIRKGVGNDSESTVCNDTNQGAHVSGATMYAADGSAIFSQGDPRWRDAPFGTSTVYDAGCGPIALAMVATALNGELITPDVVAAAAEDYYVDGSGSSHMLALGVAPQFGLRAEQIQPSVEAINSALDDGGMVWMCGSGSVPFSGRGHCIAVRSKTTSGKWLVFDSYATSSGHSPDKEYEPRSVVANISGGTTALYKQ